MKAKHYGKKVTKWEIACKIEQLPGNRPWGLYSQMTLYYDHYGLQELAGIYNKLITEKNLQFEQITIE